MRKLILTIAATLGALPLALSMPSVAHAAPCRDAKGKFIKCAKPAAAATPVKKGPCKDAKGKFIKCK